MKWKHRLKHSSCGPNYFSMGIWSVLSLTLKAILLDEQTSYKWNFCVLVPQWHGCNLFIALTSNKYAARPYKSTHFHFFHVNACSHSWFKCQVCVFAHKIYCNRPTPYVSYVWFHTDGREPGHTNLLISWRKDRWERNRAEISNLCLYR